MKRFLYLAICWAIALLTIVSVASCGVTFVEVGRSGIAETSVGQAALTIGWIINIMTWGAVVVPLGILALLLKTPAASAPNTERSLARIEPTLR